MADTTPQQEKRLAQVEARAEELIAYAPAGIYEISLRPPGFLRVNDAMCLLLGYSREELLGMDPFDLLTPESAADFASRMAQVEAGHVPATDVEYRVRRKDGSEVDVELHARFVCDAEGRPEVGFVIGHDVTEWRANQRALQTTQDRFRDVLEHALDAAYRRDLVHDRYDYMSPVIESICGFSAEQFAAMPIEEVLSRIHPHDLPALQRAMVESERSGALSVMYRFRARDGRWVWFSDNARITRDQDGTAVYRSGIVRDVTAQKETELALQRSAERFEMLSEANAMLLETLEPESAVQSIAEKVVAHLDCDVFFNYVLDASSGRLHLNACGGVDEGDAAAIEWLDVGSAICGCVAQAGTRIVSEDVQGNGDERASLVRSMGVQAYACHPLTVRGETIGTLSFGARRRPSFSDDDLALMRTVADQVSIAMERSRIADDRARLLDREHDRRERIEALHGVMEAAVSTLDPHEAAERMLDYLVQNHGFELANVWLSTGNQLELLASVGYPDSYAEKHSPMSLSAPYDAPKVVNSGRAIFVPDTAQANPTVRVMYEAIGVRLGAYVIVPLRSAERVVGTLHFGWADPHPLLPEEAEFYLSLGHELGVVLENAKLYESERHIAETLQETLVALPRRVAGIEFSRSYESATYQSGRVGGDFLDVFEVRGDEIGITLGDVSGKGIDAAVTTSLIRTTLRVHAIDGLSPAQAATKANQVMRRFTETESFVTLWFGLLNTKTGHLRYVCAGHPPAMILPTEGQIRTLECRDPILGAFDDAPFFECQSVLLPRERLLLYSDGVTEARSSDGRFLHEEGLIEMIERYRGGTTKEFAQRIMDEVLRYSEGVLRDDAALLAVEVVGGS